MKKINYNSRGYAEDCTFLTYKSKARSYECIALSDFYNDTDDDPDEHNCLGCVFHKTREQLMIEKNKANERLKIKKY